MLSPAEDYFSKVVAPLPTNRLTKAYIIGVFADLARGSSYVQDLSKESLVLRHLAGGAFTEAQATGDWVLWVLTWFPAAVADHRDVVETIGQLAYLRCYRLVPTWRVYDELADQLPTYVRRLAAVPDITGAKATHDR